MKKNSPLFWSSVGTIGFAIFTIWSIVRLTWDIARLGNNFPSGDIVMLLAFSGFFLVSLIRTIKLLRP